MRRNFVVIVIGALLCGTALTSVSSSAGAAPGPTKPGAPQSLVVTPVDTAIVVSWSAPATDGGSPITRYVDEIDSNDAACTPTGPTSCIATGLRNGKKYKVRVWAVNAVGQGKAAKARQVIPTAAQNCTYVGEYGNLQGCPNLNFGGLGGGLNLTGVNLSGTAIQNDNLSGDDLTNADLGGANMYSDNLSGDTLSGANLHGADLRAVSSGGIVGTPANLEDNNDVTWQLVDGYLIGPGAELAGVDLSAQAMVSPVDLAGADLYGTDLSDVTGLSGANFTGATMQYLSLANDDLTGADLTQGNIFSANFSNANLTDVDLSDGTVLGANFAGAALDTVDFTNENLSYANFTGATFSGPVTWSNTTCPDQSNSDTNGSSPPSCIGYGI